MGFVLTVAGYDGRGRTVQSDFSMRAIVAADAVRKHGRLTLGRMMFLIHGAIPLLSEEFDAAIGCFFDQEPHLGMRGLEVDGKSMLAQFL